MGTNVGCFFLFLLLPNIIMVLYIAGSFGLCCFTCGFVLSYFAIIGFTVFWNFWFCFVLFCFFLILTLFHNLIFTNCFLYFWFCLVLLSFVIIFFYFVVISQPCMLSRHVRQQKNLQTACCCFFLFNSILHGQIWLFCAHKGIRLKKLGTKSVSY